LQALSIGAFLLTQNEAGLFIVAASYGFGFSGIISAYVVSILDRGAESRFREEDDLGNMARTLLHGGRFHSGTPAPQCFFHDNPGKPRCRFVQCCVPLCDVAQDFGQTRRTFQK
jgi:hypothetical protein